MPRAERPRGACPICGKDCAITDAGGVRHHITEDPAKQAGPDSRTCKGVGQPPDGAQAHPGDLRFLCRVPSGPDGCGHQVHLTANYRARTHLTPHGVKCAEGSSAPPIAVGPDGFREDTAEWTEAKWAEMLPKPQPPGPGTRPAAAPEALRLGSDDPVEDFLGTGGPTVAERAAAAGDGRTAAQQAEIDRRMADPVGSTLESLLSAEVGQPGTVLDALGFDPQDPEGPGEAPTAYEQRGRQILDAIKEMPPDEDALFDPSHVYDDGHGGTWVHPGRAEGCTMPECCKHPRGFEYVDDDNGKCGEFCPQCGSEAPEPCTHPEPVYGGTDENGADVWVCEACGERENPAVSRMRARYRARCIVGELDEGLLFVRHTRPEPVGSLIFRVQKVHPEAIEAIVVSAGPYGGRTGPLTDLQEEITCTDLEGKPRPRVASDPAVQRPTLRQRPTSSQAGLEAPTSSPTGTATDRSSRPGTTASATSPTAPRTAISGKVTSSGPTDSAGTSTRGAPVTTEAQAAGDFLTAGAGSYGEAEARYGRWGRYKLTHPATGQTVEWTRATTFAKSISDTFTLSQWGKRNVLVGATLRPDIVAAAHGKDVSKDREQLNTWAEELEQAAGSKVAANLGTAVHSFTEAVDRRWADRWKVLREETPEEFRPHVEAYILLLEEHGLEPVPHMIEFSTGVLQYEVMGTSDNCYRVTKHLVLKMPRGEVRLSPGEHVIGDKKTGKDLDYGWQEICIQLALYAQGVNTQGVFNWADMTWEPDPLSRYAEPGTKVREDVGIIMHLPVDPRSTKRPALYGVDLESGWNAVVLCERVRVWRKLRNLAGPVAVVDVDPLRDDPVSARPPAQEPRAAVRPPTLRERAEAVTSKTEASRVYQDAIAAKVPVAEAKELISIMEAAIAKVAEPGGAKV